NSLKLYKESIMSTTANNTAEARFVPPAEDAMDETSDPEVAYQKLLERLCDASVTKRYEAYRDIDWDAPEMQVDQDDPRWELAKDHPLGATQWYQSQPDGIRSRIGLNLSAGFCYTGRIFEGILSRGLLRFAATQPHNSLEYRFAYHEVIEEAHHSLMFQEFVNRAGLPVPTMTSEFIQNSSRIAEFGTTFPEMLFIYALGGEDPIDYVQREGYRKAAKGHPLNDRISQIHITEEARHVAFARAYLSLNVPKLSDEKRHEMSLTVPTILGTMSKMMMQPPEHIIATYNIPPEVIDEAFTNNPVHRNTVVASLSKLRKLCEKLGLMNDEAKEIWRENGLLPE
ncbi:MAG: diiron oxygenase, partial [Gammaproteobacteria bacterium]|nr:diiron oxygenase [Gammaproteobacteria bacterium]